MSKEWRDKRVIILKTRNCCECCKSQKVLQIHHLHYRNIFCEDLEKDLVVLCKKCHELVHKWYDNRTDKYRSLEEVTKDIIQNYYIRLGNKKPIKKKEKFDPNLYRYSNKDFKKRERSKQDMENRVKKKELKRLRKLQAPIPDSPAIAMESKINRLYQEVLQKHKKKLNKMPA